MKSQKNSCSWLIIKTTCVLCVLSSRNMCYGSGRLFSAGLPDSQWVEFDAAGFAAPVSGIIYRDKIQPVCGVPLGGVATGCLDIGADGRLGLCTIFSHVWGHDDGTDWGAKDRKDHGQYMRDRVKNADGSFSVLSNHDRGPLNKPFLGLAIGEKTWVLTTEKIKEVQTAKKIDYWGHYPVVDMEFQLDCPIRVGMRAWCPFIPGDIPRSMIPGAMFEVRLRNNSPQIQTGSVAFNFPGPRERETNGLLFSRKQIQNDLFKGIYISTSEKVGYVLASTENDAARTGGGLGSNGESWASIGSSLPSISQEQNTADGSASLAVNFQLKANETKIIQFMLTWYAPQWHASWPEGKISNWYTKMYTIRYHDALEVADYLAVNHESLLQSVLAWQQVIYQDEQLPGWLRDGLVNILHLITESSFWAFPREPLGNWCFPEGVFSLVESTVAAGQQSCIPCDWYGNLPVVYFFPELARNTLRAYKHFMTNEGTVPFVLGVGLNLTGDFQHTRQQTLNGCCYTFLVDRLWLRTGDDAILEEFYPSVKKVTEFVINLVPGDEGVISTAGDQWYESMAWPGMSSHVGGVRLAHLRIAERMAEKMRDKDFAMRCRAWYEQGSKALEKNMWAGTHYLLYKDLTSNKSSNLILAFQLDGEWIADLHGVQGVFFKDRIDQTLATIKKTNIPSKNANLVNVIFPDGTVTNFGGRMGGMCSTAPSIFITSMNYIYEGDRQSGLEIAYRCLNTVANTLGMMWDMPNMFRGDPGNEYRMFGTDYYQAMSLWGMPAALAGKDITGPCDSGGLISRIIKAGREKKNE